MEKKNIIIISLAVVLIILIAAWFIFDPFASNESTIVENQIAAQEQASPHVAEQPKTETKKETQPKEKKTKSSSENGRLYIV